MTQVNKFVFSLVLATFVGLTILVSATRVEAQESRERMERERIEQEMHEYELQRERVARAEEEEAERVQQRRKLEHMMVALGHLREAGMEELANEVERHVDELQANVRRSHERSERREGEPWHASRQVERQRRREMEQRESEFRSDVQRREREMQLEMRDRERAVRDETQQREREMQLRERDLEARNNENQEFQHEVMVAISEISAVVRQLREEVNELKGRDRAKDE